jgi:hypothetical protein
MYHVNDSYSCIRRIVCSKCPIQSARPLVNNVTWEGRTLITNNTPRTKIAWMAGLFPVNRWICGQNPWNFNGDGYLWVRTKKQLSSEVYSQKGLIFDFVRQLNLMLNLSVYGQSSWPSLWVSRIYQERVLGEKTGIADYTPNHWAN